MTDQGCGFCKEKLARLFEPFFTTKKQGMGIGLSICKTSIEVHGGRVTTENSPNRAAAMFHDRRRNPQGLIRRVILARPFARPGAPLSLSVKMRLHPALLSASSCISRFWSRVETRAYPIRMG